MPDLEIVRNPSRFRRQVSNSWVVQEFELKVSPYNGLWQVCYGVQMSTKDGTPVCLRAAPQVEACTPLATAAPMRKHPAL